MEQLDLSTPVSPRGGTSYWKVRGKSEWYDDADSSRSYIKITLVGANGERRSVEYSGQEAHDLLKAYNRLDFSAPNDSQHARILKKLKADGRIGDGVISGSPDA